MSYYVATISTVRRHGCLCLHTSQTIRNSLPYCVQINQHSRISREFGGQLVQIKFLLDDLRHGVRFVSNVSIPGSEIG